MAIDWNASLTAAGIDTQEKADAAARVMALTYQKLVLQYQITALDTSTEAARQAAEQQKQSLLQQIIAIDNELTPH